jgi:lipoprotein-anchoring transpeptidase ErfK/SrfK
VVAFVAAVTVALAPSQGAAAEVTRFPAAGPLVESSVAVRRQPTASSKRMMTLYELRRDYRPQIVLAIGSRRVGFVPATHARLVIPNSTGAGALELRARAAGKESNTIRISIQNVAVSPAEDDLVIFVGGVELFRFRHADADIGTLANQINASSAPVSTTVLAGGSPLAQIGPTALAGGTNGKPGTLWYRLNLPIRPYGQKGWIPASAADVRTTTRRLVVHRGSKVLVVLNRGRRIFRTRVAVGRPDRRTPLGSFYVAAKYRPPLNALVSAYALELSAPAGLPDFLRGGVVGIHGTPATWSIGKEASNGCIRVRSSAAYRLKRLVPVGTPVSVVR